MHSASRNAYAGPRLRYAAHAPYAPPFLYGNSPRCKPYRCLFPRHTSHIIPLDFRIHTTPQITYKMVCCKDAEWDTGSHFNSKQQSSVPGELTKTSVSIASFKGISPLTRFGAQTPRKREPGQSHTKKIQKYDRLQRTDSKFKDT